LEADPPREIIDSPQRQTGCDSRVYVLVEVELDIHPASLAFSRSFLHSRYVNVEAQGDNIPDSANALSSLDATGPSRFPMEALGRPCRLLTWEA